LFPHLRFLLLASAARFYDRWGTFVVKQKQLSPYLFSGSSPRAAQVEITIFLTPSTCLSPASFPFLSMPSLSMNKRCFCSPYAVPGSELISVSVVHNLSLSPSSLYAIPLPFLEAPFLSFLSVFSSITFF